MEREQTFLLGDFGEAIFDSEERHLNGTENYMSPEVLRGEKNFDYRTDIWAIGVVVAEKALGIKELFPGLNGKEVLNNINKWNQSQKSSLSSCSYLNKLVSSMLAFYPKDRPYASSLLKELNENWDKINTKK